MRLSLLPGLSDYLYAGTKQSKSAWYHAQASHLLSPSLKLLCWCLSSEATQFSRMMCRWRGELVLHSAKPTPVGIEADKYSLPYSPQAPASWTEKQVISISGATSRTHFYPAPLSPIPAFLLKPLKAWAIASHSSFRWAKAKTNNLPSFIKLLQEKIYSISPLFFCISFFGWFRGMWNVKEKHSGENCKENTRKRKEKAREMKCTVQLHTVDRPFATSLNFHNNSMKQK